MDGTIGRHLVMDGKQREALIEGHVGLAKSIAKDFYVDGLDLEDLEQEAMLALARAARDYDSSKNTKFITFAVRAIRADLKDLLRVSQPHDEDVVAHAIPFTDLCGADVCLDEFLSMEEIGEEC